MINYGEPSQPKPDMELPIKWYLHWQNFCQQQLAVLTIDI